MSLVDYATAARRRTSNWRTRRVQPGLLLAWAVMIVAALMAIAPQLFTAYSPLEGFPGAQRLAPQAGHWLGTDQLGRDLWSRIVFGAVHSLSAALAAVAIGLFIGTALGTLAGALAGRVESAIMRLVDVLLAIPSLLLSLTVIILLGFGTLNAVEPGHDEIKRLSLDDGIANTALEVLEARPQIQLFIFEMEVKVDLVALVFFGLQRSEVGGFTLLAAVGVGGAGDSAIDADANFFPLQLIHRHDINFLQKGR